DAHYDVLPGNGDLTAAELKLMDALAREHRLKDVLAKVAANYHTILIDCPPSLNLLTLNALTAADGVLIPVQCEYFALEGLSSLLDTVKAVRHRLNPKLEIEGLLRTMRLAEAPSHGQPIHLYDRSSRGAIAYIGLAGEIIRRERGLSVAAEPNHDIEPPAHGEAAALLKAPAAHHQE